jgi:hypothetical protein
MNALLNIGLRTNTGTINAHDICVQFDAFHVADLKHRVAVATDLMEEDTYITHVSGWTRDKAYAIAHALHQDCIAQYDLEECEGALIGPHATAWGAFDARFFKLL